MEITDVRIRKILNDKRLRAVVSITLNNAVAVHDIKIVQGDDRLFVSMPSRKEENGEFRDIIHPINFEVRKQIEDKIISSYHQHLAEAETNPENKTSELIS